ncbi:MAG: hypothetical protein WDW36_005056 [Sanguina aurantia]
MPADVEAVPLLFVPASPAKPMRGWRGHWATVWGQLAPLDLIAALLTIKVPFAAAAWNNHRALERSFCKEMMMWVCIGLTYFLLAMVVQSSFMAGRDIGSSLAEGSERSVTRADTCVHSLDFHHGGMALDSQSVSISSNGDMLSLGASSRTGADSTNLDRPDSNNNNNFARDADDTNHGGPRDHGPHPHPHFALFELPPCLAPHAAWIGAAAVAAILILTWSVVMHLARSRQEMRTRFGIPGTFVGDLALWTFCAPCALAQETRTLMHANVSEGMWHGAIEPFSAPAPLCMA